MAEFFDGTEAQAKAYERLRPCDCQSLCGDDGDIDGPGVCKGLPIEKKPLVEIVMVPK